jgi:regulator of replication initiation timing
VDITSQYLSDEDFNGATSGKLEEASKSIEEMKGQLRIMEARNIRLSTENTKLNETVRQASELISESRKVSTASKKEAVITEQKERVQKAKNVTGSGHTVDKTDGVVIAEYANPNHEISDLLVLSGVKKTQ